MHNQKGLIQMPNILDEIAAYARIRVREARERISEEELRTKALALPKGDFPFEKALKKPGISFICECKKASPSKGLIAPDFPYVQIAKEYEAAGADCISVLTEPKWFLGSGDYLREIAGNVSIPIIRKDFTVDPYMIYEAKVLGASAVLLICAILSEEEIREYIKIADSIGLSQIVEAHDEAEIELAVRAGARIIGVNNRNLKDFTVDTNNSKRLRQLVPEGVIFVSESGVKTAEDIENIREMGADAALVGETLMRAKNKRLKLNELKGVPNIKMCGMSRPEDISVINELRPELVGFVFYPKSIRNVTPEKAAELKALLRPEIKAVGVFVNSPADFVSDLFNRGIIDIAQLHGSESEEYMAELRAKTGNSLEIIKVFKTDSPENLKAAEKSSADMIMFDPGLGNGNTFNWECLKNVSGKYILAGGLNPENVAEAVALLKPYGVDVSSGIETDGKKDSAKMAAFYHAVRAE